MNLETATSYNATLSRDRKKRINALIDEMMCAEVARAVVKDYLANIRIAEANARADESDARRPCSHTGSPVTVLAPKAPVRTPRRLSVAAAATAEVGSANLRQGVCVPDPREKRPLRGIAALNAAKTVCVHGHPFDERNTYRDPNGRRQCRGCDRERDRIRRRTPERRAYRRAAARARYAARKAAAQSA